MQRGRGLPEFRHELIPCDFSTHLRPSVQRIQIQAFEGTDLDAGNTEIFDLWLRSFGNYCTMLSPTFQIRTRDTHTSCLETFESNITQVMSQSSSLERKWANHELSYPHQHADAQAWENWTDVFTRLSARCILKSSPSYKHTFVRFCSLLEQWVIDLIIN